MRSGPPPASIYWSNIRVNVGLPHTKSGAVCSLAAFTRIPTVEHPSTSKEAHPRRRRCASVRVSTGVVDFNEVADIFAEFSAASLSGAGMGSTHRRALCDLHYARRQVRVSG